MYLLAFRSPSFPLLLRRYVALVDFIDSGTLRLKRYDLFKARVHLALFPASARSAAGLFPDLPMSGAHFRVGTLPYDAYCTADENPDPLADEYHAFVNHSGFEILMLQEVAKRKVSSGDGGTVARKASAKQTDSDN